MAPITFHLITVPEPAPFITALSALPPASQPLYVGDVHHWIHEPTLSVEALTGTGPEVHKWTHLLVHHATAPESSLALPRDSLAKHISSRWSITAPASEEMLAAFATSKATRNAKSTLPLPPGWSAHDSSGLQASHPPQDLEASLALSSIPMGSSRNSPPTKLKDFITSFGTTHPGPISMFNLLAYQPGQRSRYFEYIAAFQSRVGAKYGGEGFLGAGVTEWSSRIAEGMEVAQPEKNGSGVWEDVALVWYPSIWHFGKMLDDPDYADVDRRFKRGAIRDNSILCCREVELSS